MSNGNDHAYPGGNGFTPYEQGLTKRELFAAMAMQGLCSNPSTFDNDAASEDEIARWSVQQADALLRAIEDGH